MLEWAPDICANSDGYMILTWNDERNGDSDIYAQCFDEDGNALGDNFLVNTDFESAHQGDAAIAADGYGNFVVVWEDSRNYYSDIYAQRFTQDGRPLGENFRVDDLDDSYWSQSNAAAACDADGGIFMVWQDERPAFSRGRKPHGEQFQGE